MSFVEVAFMVVVGFGILAGSVYFGFYVSARTIREQNAHVALVNATLEAVALATGFEIIHGAPYDHPMGGRIEGYPTLRGQQRGRAVRLQVTNVYEVDELAIVVAPAPGAIWPHLGRVDAKRARRRAPSLAPALERLQPLVERIVIEPAELVVIPRAAKSGSALTSYCDVSVAPAKLVEILAIATSLADALDALGPPHAAR